MNMNIQCKFQERYVTSIGDLVTLAIFLCITPQVREAAAALARGEKKGWSLWIQAKLDMFHTIMYCE